MADNEVKLIISADNKQAIQASQEIQNAYKTLSTTSIAEIDRQKAQIIAAYNTIRNSGVASASEITNAERAKNKAIEDLNKQMSGSQTSTIAKIKENWLGAVAAITGAMVTIKEGWNLADTASQFDEQKESLNALAAQYGTTANAMISSIQQASRGMISQFDAVSLAAQGLMKGLNPDQLTNLSKAAETFSNVSGRKVVDIFSELSEALETGRAKALKMQVGIIDLDAVYGNAASTMSDAEKAQAMYNIVMERATALQQTLGESSDSVNDKMEQFTVTLKDGQLALGQSLIKGAQLVVAFGEAWTGASLIAITGISKIAQGLGWLLEKLPLVSDIGKSLKEWGANSSSAAWDTAKEQFAKMQDNLSLVFSWGSSTGDTKSSLTASSTDSYKTNLKKEQDDLKASLTTRVADYQKYYTDLKKLQDDYKSAIEKSLKEIADIDKSILESRRSTQELLYQVNQKGNPATNEMEEYNRKVMKLDSDLTYAMTLSGEDRVKALQEYQRAWTDMVKEINYTSSERVLGENGYEDSSVTKTWLSLGDSAKTASDRISEAGSLIEQAQQEMRAQAETQLNKQVEMFNLLTESVNNADEWVKYLKTTIADLDSGLANPRTLTIDCRAALDQLQQVLSYVSQINATSVGASSMAVSSQMQSLGVSNYTQSNDISFINDTYAVGTKYVPRTGNYRLHEGEEVRTKEEVTAERSKNRSVSISFGDVVISGTNKDAGQLSREFLMKVKAGLRKLDYLAGA